jgi:uncharacterized protein (TIGR02596 family)
MNSSVTAYPRFLFSSRVAKHLASPDLHPVGRTASQRAFSIVELLAVVSVVLFMLGMSVPGFLSMKAGLDLQNGALEVTNCLEAARQTARTLNGQAEIRLFTKGDGIHGMQVYVRKAQSSEWTPWTKAVVLPDTVEISGNTTYSTLLGALASAPLVDEKGREYRRFRFQADGSADFSGSGNGTLTVMAKRDSEKLGLSGGELPSNFAVIQIDPEIGGIKVFRP